MPKFALEIYYFNFMNDKDLSVKLRTDARRLGLCDKWYNNWKDETDKKALIDKFKRGVDFCIKHRWPAKQFIKHHFPQDILRENGILVDDTRSYPVRDPETRRQIFIREYVLIGESSITVRYMFAPHMCNIWALDDSKVTVKATRGAFILIHLFDNATADVTTDLGGNVTVIRHSEATSVKRNGCVTIKEEFNYI